MKKFLIFAGLIFVLVVLIFMTIRNKENPSQSTIPILIKGSEINAKIAKTESERVKGLSQKESLMENEGLLFVFEEEGYPGIWMKDMKFPIDIAWMDKNQKIIHLEKNVSPETYPKVFYARKNNVPILSLYVLEISAGFFEKNEIEIGDRAEFVLP